MSDTIANACSVLTQFKHCNKLAARCDDHAMHHHHAMACIIIITALTPHAPPHTSYHRAITAPSPPAASYASCAKRHGGFNQAKAAGACEYEQVA
jgi:hypothetical protein